MTLRRLAAALCAVLLASSCANLGTPPPLSGAEMCAAHASRANPALQNGGVGGTGQVAQRPGIGGTGAVAQGGVGGTGQREGGVGGTGIVGIITGFASICVNGVEVHYDATTPVLRDGQAAPARELAVGQVVAVRASAAPGSAKDQLQAQRIAVIDAAVGPLSRVDAATGELELLGQRATALERSNLVGLKAGDWVRVSGHRLASGEIRASRVQGLGAGLPAGAAQGTVAAQVMGPVTALQGLELRIGSTPVRFAPQSMPVGLALGQELAVSGNWSGQVLQAQSALLQPTRAGLGDVREVVLQGYVHALRGRELVLGYESLQLSEGLRIGGGSAEQLRVGQHVQISGRVGAGQRITAERLEFSREGSRSGSGKSADDSDESDDSSGQGRGRGRGRSGGTSGGDDSGGSSGSGSGKGGSGSGGSGSGSGSGGSGSGGGGGSSGSGSGK